jgi:hypothetical protein
MPSVYELALNAFAVAAQDNTVIFQTACDGILRPFLAEQPEIRIWMADTSNYGHQSSTIVVMYRLIAFGAQTIRLIYNPGEPTEPTWDKLVLLILGLPGQPVRQHTVAGATVYFDTVEEFTSGGHAEVDFGITGGWDGNTALITEALNIRCFLCLQPYFWMGTETEIATNIVYFRQGLEEVEFPPELFMIERAYFIDDVPSLTDGQWQAFYEWNQRKSGCVAAVERLCNDNIIEMLPVYFSPGRPNDQFEDIFFNVIAGIIRRNRSLPATKPTVLLMMGRTDPGDYGFLRDMLQGRVIGPDGTVLSGDVFPYRRGYLARNYAEAFQRVIFLDTPDFTGREIIEEVQRFQDGIVIVALERVPRVVFNFLFNLATLPPIFEGMGTASLALNLGRGYFHLVTGSPQSDLYPLPPLSTALTATPFSNFCGISSSALGYPAWMWDLLLNPSSPTGDLPDLLISRFITLARTTMSELNQDFLAQRTFFHNPEEDKFLVGIFYALLQMRQRGIIAFEERAYRRTA